VLLLDPVLGGILGPIVAVIRNNNDGELVWRKGGRIIKEVWGDAENPGAGIPEIVGEVEKTLSSSDVQDEPPLCRLDTS
jgi:hypothetical protein